MRSPFLKTVSKNKYFKFINRLDRIVWLIILTLAIVILLEYTTPPEYVFGYLYTGTILLANYGLKTKTIGQITLAAIALTIFNLFFPNFEPHSPATIANRLITVNITVGTVRVHVHAILQKLEVRDRTSAAIMAIQQNLIIY
jgi:Bacterial regulatory proteins, luxR family